MDKQEGRVRVDITQDLEGANLPVQAWSNVKSSAAQAEGEMSEANVSPTASEGKAGEGKEEGGKITTKDERAEGGGSWSQPGYPMRMGRGSGMEERGDEEEEKMYYYRMQRPQYYYIPLEPRYRAPLPPARQPWRGLAQGRKIRCKTYHQWKKAIVTEERQKTLG